MKFSPFPERSTPRLILRRIESFDSPEILFLRSDKTVNKYIQRPPDRQTKNEEDALQFIQSISEALENGVSIAWGITLSPSAKLIGSICLWNFSDDGKTAELGYDLHPRFHGKGLMREAIKVVLEFGFSELYLDMIEAYTHRENESSKNLLKRNGFRLVEGKMDEENANNLIFELKNDRK